MRFLYQKLLAVSYDCIRSSPGSISSHRRSACSRTCTPSLHIMLNDKFLIDNSSYNVYVNGRTHETHIERLQGTRMLEIVAYMYNYKLPEINHGNGKKQKAKKSILQEHFMSLSTPDHSYMYSTLASTHESKTCYHDLRYWT